MGWQWGGGGGTWQKTLSAGLEGYMKGSQMKDDKKAREDDRAYREEVRARQRAEWADQDAIRSGFKDGAQEPVGLQDASPLAQPQATPAPGGADGSVSSAMGLESAQATPVPTGDAGKVGLDSAKAAPSVEAHAQRLLRGYENAMAGAAKRGDLDGYAKLFDRSASVRGVVRSKLRDSADREFALNGGTDFSPYIGIYNKWFDDGHKINSIDQDEKGNYVLTGVDRSGKEFTRPVGDKNAMHTMVNTMFDPGAARAMEAQRANEIWKSSVKVKEQAAIDENKTKNDMLLEDHKAGLKPPEVVKASGGEGKPDKVGTVGKDGKVKWQDGGEPEAGPLDIKTTTALRSAIMGMYKVSDMESMSPDIRQKVGNAMTYSSMLIQSNQGTEAGKRLDVNTAANIASQIADGKAPEQKFTDKSGNVWRGVTVGGVKYLLDPQPISRGGQAPAGGNGAPVDATASASPRSVSGKIRSNDGGQEWAGLTEKTQTEQPARDTTAGKLIIDEYGSVDAAKAGLAELNKAISDTKEPTARKILEGEKKRLEAGLAAVSGSQKQKQAPSAAIAYLEAHPESAPQFKQKFGYLPEGF